MNNRNLLLKIIKFALILGSSFMGNRLLAEDLRICPEHLTKLGTKVQLLDKNQSLVTITKKISIKNALNNESLQEHIASVKLIAAEEFQKYKSGNFQERRSEYGGVILKTTYDSSWDQMKRSLASMKEKYICIKKGSSTDEIFFTGEWSPESEKKSKNGGIIVLENYNNSWDQMKRSIASMKEKYLCVKKGRNKDEILFTGEWSTKSIKRVGRIIEYHEAHTE